MPPEEIISHFAARQDWDLDSQLVLVLRYIENQQSHAAFEDFLQQQADLENEQRPK